MKKLLNDPSRVVREMLEGLAMFAPDTALLRDANVVVRRDLPEPPARPAAIISGGGSGHELACRPHSPDGCSVRRSGCRANRQIPGIAESAHYARASLWAAIVGSGCAGGVRFAARVVAGMGINAGKKC
jgi:hypothetical protein